MAYKTRQGRRQLQHTIQNITVTAQDESQDVDKAARWVAKKQLQLNSLMSQDQIDELGRQLAECENGELKRAVVERWIDAYTLEYLAVKLDNQYQAFGARVARKAARRLRKPDNYALNLEYAESEIIGLATSYPHLRDEVEKMFLATPDVLYSIAVCFDDENDLPFQGEDNV